MNAKILQVNYRCSLSRQAFEETLAPSANDLATFPGLRWKIWLVNEEQGSYGGIHLFDDQASVDAYLSQVIEDLKGHPAVSDVTSRTFDIVEKPSLVMHAPIRDSVRV